jgi:hypothetical protein
LSNITIDTLPAEIRLIAAVSRLIDFHQSRREAGGTYAPSIPDTAGANLFLALSIIESLHEIEMDRGVGCVPVSELANHLKHRIPSVTSDDVEFCIANLKNGREIHYRTRNDAGEIVDGRTWDTTPLLDAQDGLSQVQLTENARLLLRITSLRESWLYSDIEADRLVKVIERGQFQDIPGFCRSMTLDLASKSKQLSGVLERPSLSELRSLLISEGQGIASSLRDAAAMITKAIDLIYQDTTEAAFDRWLGTASGTVMARDGITLGNLQADLQLVLQNVEALSRRFLDFIEHAQKVRNEGIEPIPFLDIADDLTRAGSEANIERLDLLFKEFMPWGQDRRIFHPSMLIGEADLSVPNEDEPEAMHTFTLDPAAPTPSSRFADFLARNKQIVIDRLREGPASFREVIELGGFALEPGDSMLDFFGVYTNPDLIETRDTRIIVGITDEIIRFSHNDHDITGNDPVMYLEQALDPN